MQHPTPFRAVQLANSLEEKTSAFGFSDVACLTAHKTSVGVLRVSRGGLGLPRVFPVAVSLGLTWAAAAEVTDRGFQVCLQIHLGLPLFRVCVL